MNVETVSNNSMVHMAMDGQTLNKLNKKVSAEINQQPVSKSIAQSGAEVVQNMEQSAAEIKEDTQTLQKMSELIAGNKLQFSVNKELGSVVISVIDANTKEVLKQIPSEEIQNLKLRIRKAIGNIFDEVI